MTSAVMSNLLTEFYVVSIYVRSKSEQTVCFQYRRK